MFTHALTHANTQIANTNYVLRFKLKHICILWKCIHYICPIYLSDNFRFHFEQCVFCCGYIVFRNSVNYWWDDLYETHGHTRVRKLKIKFPCIFKRWSHSKRFPSHVRLIRWHFALNSKLRPNANANTNCMHTSLLFFFNFFFNAMHSLYDNTSRFIHRFRDVSIEVSFLVRTKSILFFVVSRFGKFAGNIISTFLYEYKKQCCRPKVIADFDVRECHCKLK